MDYRLSGRLDLLKSTHSTLWLGELGLLKESQRADYIFLKKYRSKPKGHPLPQKKLKRKLTSVTTLSLGFISQSNSGTRVYDGGFLDDKTITVKTCNVSAGVGKSNLVDFVGVQPNLALAALQNGSGEALLKLQRDCHEKRNN